MTHPTTTCTGEGANTASTTVYDLVNVLLNPVLSTLSDCEQKKNV
jgi:hypothetical protein